MLTRAVAVLVGLMLGAPLAAAPTVVQQASLDSFATTITCDFASAITETNLVVIVVGTKGSTLNSPAGYDTAIEEVNGGLSDTLRIAYDVADAGEADPAVGNPDGESTVFACYELSGMVTNQASVFDTADDTAVSGGTVTTQAVGPTATLAQAEEWCVAGIFGRNAAMTAGSFSSNVYAGGGIESDDATVGLLHGYLVTAGTTAQQTTGSWSGAVLAMSALACFKVAGGGGGGLEMFLPLHSIERTHGPHPSARLGGHLQ